MLTCARRTLKWREIQGAVSLDLDEGVFSPDLKFQDDCKDLCASLVERNSDDSVTLVHSTAKKYPIPQDPGKDHIANAYRYLVQEGHVCIPEVEFDLTYLCLTYLSLDHLTLHVNDDIRQSGLQTGVYVFMDYATCFWAEDPISRSRDLAALDFCESDDLVAAINSFLFKQWASPKKRLVVLKTLESSLSALTSEDSCASICQAVVSNTNQLLRSSKGPSDDEPLHLANVVQDIRIRLADMLFASRSNAPERQLLQAFYGTDISNAVDSIADSTRKASQQKHSEMLTRRNTSDLSRVKSMDVHKL